MKYILGYFTDQIMLICMIISSAIMTMWWLKFQKKLNMKWYIAIILSVSHFILGAVALKIWGGLEVFLGFDDNATMKLFGGLFLLPPIYYLGAKLTKRDPVLVMDISSICCFIGFFCRISCIVDGCCQGIPITNTTLRWPLNEIELVFCTIFVLSFWQIIYRRKLAGYIYPIMMISYGTLRFIIEWLREEYTTVGVFHLAHIWSLLAVAIGVTAICLINKKNKEENKQISKNKSKRRGN